MSKSVNIKKGNFQPSFPAWQTWCISNCSVCFAVFSFFWVFVLYWSALGAPFVYDDLDQIVRNPALDSFRETFRLYCLAPSAFTNQFRGLGGTNFRPLFWLSLSMDRHFWGAKGAGGFHFTNVFLHWINGCLLFSVLRRARVPVSVGAATALIWLGMPINTEPVAWISGREYILCGMFLLLMLQCAVSYLTSRSVPALIGAFVFSLAALLSHESGVLALPLILLIALTMGSLFRPPVARLASCIAASYFTFAGVRQFVGVHAGEGGPRFWSIGLAFWKYVAWMLAPVRMSMQRSMSTPPETLSSKAVLSLCALAGVSLVTFLIRKKLPQLAVGITWMLIAILPFCGIVSIYQGMAERFCYFASAGLALGIASLIFQRRKILRQFICGLVLIWVAWGVWRLKARVVDWCDPVTLYESSIEATPDPMLFYDLGWAWRERGDFEKALVEYQEAVRRRPTYQEAQASVGQMLSILGHPHEALAPYDEALTLKPDDSPTRVDLAMTLAEIGEKTEAENEFKIALAYTPGNYSALNDFGSMLVQEGRLNEAAPYFQQAIQAKPNEASAYYNLGALFAQLGQMDRALPLFQKVLQLSPDDPDTLSILAKIYGRR